jgi:hypothetical protein
MRTYCGGTESSARTASSGVAQPVTDGNLATVAASRLIAEVVVAAGLDP